MPELLEPGELGTDGLVGGNGYLCGPMTGYPNHNFNTFNAAAYNLRERGMIIKNPAELFNGNQALPRADYIREDLYTLLGQVDYLILLPGWEESAGARLEILVAQELGYPLYLYAGSGPIPLLDDDRIVSPAHLVPASYSYALPVQSTITEEEEEVCAPPPETILEEAQRLVYGDRGETYGHPIDDFTRTGKIWGAILDIGRDVTAEEVALCMMGLKISRETYQPKRDNLTDIAGYALCQDRIVRKRKERLDEIHTLTAMFTAADDLLFAPDPTEYDDDPEAVCMNAPMAAA